MDWKELDELSKQLQKLEINCLYDKGLKRASFGWAYATIKSFNKSEVRIKLEWGIDDENESEVHTLNYIFNRKTKSMEQL